MRAEMQTGCFYAYVAWCEYAFIGLTFVYCSLESTPLLTPPPSPSCDMVRIVRIVRLIPHPWTGPMRLARDALTWSIRTLCLSSRRMHHRWSVGESPLTPYLGTLPMTMCSTIDSFLTKLHSVNIATLSYGSPSIDLIAFS
jgi:hypothetical protein